MNDKRFRIQEKQVGRKGSANCEIYYAVEYFSWSKLVSQLSIPTLLLICGTYCGVVWRWHIGLWLSYGTAVVLVKRENSLGWTHVCTQPTIDNAVEEIVRLKEAKYSPKPKPQKPKQWFL